MLKITLTRSLIGSNPKQRANAEAMGLRRIGDVKQFPDSPTLAGKLRVISHLVSVEAVQAATKKAPAKAKAPAKPRTPKAEAATEE